jgi:hypothetical protein
MNRQSFKMHHPIPNVVQVLQRVLPGSPGKILRSFADRGLRLATLSS